MRGTLIGSLLVLCAACASSRSKGTPGSDGDVPLASTSLASTAGLVGGGGPVSASPGNGSLAGEAPLVDLSKDGVAGSPGGLAIPQVGTAGGDATVPGSAGGTGGARAAEIAAGGGPAVGAGGALAAGADSGAMTPPAEPSQLLVVPELEELPSRPVRCPSASGGVALETAEFCLTLDPDSHTVTALRPKTELGFDFTPSDRLSERSGPGYFHLGDITLRVRSGDSEPWEELSTAGSGSSANTVSPVGDELAAMLLAPQPTVSGLQIKRSWAAEKGRLALRFELSNSSDGPIEVGALGIPLIFNNIITGRSLEEAHERCSLVEPYIGQDAGYVQVTKLNGAGPVLLLIPESGTPLEAYNPILNPPAEGSLDPKAVFTDLTPRNNTFEGFYEWMVTSRAYAEGEWAGAIPWNAPHSIQLAPGETHRVGIRFVLAAGVRQAESVLSREQRPVAVGVPGYILPTDLQGKLFVKYSQPVSAMDTEPPGALELSPLPDAASWQAFSVQATGWGRSRLRVTYADGAVQTIHYYATKPAADVVADMGEFLTTKAWFEAAEDPFGRSPSVMTYDRDTQAVVTQEKQAWVAGLGDDGGATWLAAIMKQLGQPDAEQVRKLEDFVDGPIWGNLQYSSGPLMHGIKRTAFYYEPREYAAGYYDSNIDWTYWGAWPKAHTLQVGRSYNYPHVTALYWTLYRLARNHTGLVSHHSWDWYLDQAYRTAIAMTTIGADYAQFGLMDGSIFLELLRDLKREGLTSESADLEAKMRARTDVWSREAYPFGSEMPWDSTGQEEVYQWTRHFGHAAKAEVCLHAILGYTQTVPHWGYNGCARRYWDFKYGGSKLDRLERMIHHYGSSLNAIPLLAEYRDHPEDIHLLRLGYAGMMGSLTNIDQTGFPAMAFHAFPDTLAWDARTGDYGLNFFGHAYNTATYVIQHPELGWLVFGGNLTVVGGRVSVKPLDSFRSRLYLAPMGLWLTLEAGTFEGIEFEVGSNAVQLALAPATAHTSSARLRIEQPGEGAGLGSVTVSGGFASERGAVVIPLGEAATTVELVR